MPFFEKVFPAFILVDLFPLHADLDQAALFFMEILIGILHLGAAEKTRGLP